MSTELALSPSQQVDKELAEKGITEALILGLEKHKSLTVDVKTENGIVIYNKEQLKMVKDALKLTKDTRILIEKTCKAERDVYNAKAKENIAKEKKYVAIISPIEAHLQTMAKSVEKAEEEIRLAEEKKKEEQLSNRINTLIINGMSYIPPAADGLFYGELNIKMSDLRTINDEAFNHFLGLVQAKFQADKAAKEAEEKRQAEEKQKQEAEAKRLEEQRLAQEKKEQEIKEAQARVDAEKKRMAEEKLNQRKATLIALGMAVNENYFYYPLSNEVKTVSIDTLEQASQEGFENYCKAATQQIEAYKTEEQARKKKELEQAAENARIAAEQKAKKDAEEKAAQEKAKAEKEAARLAKQPDKVKLLGLADQLRDFPMPEVKSADAKNVLASTQLELKTVIDNLIKAATAI